jgi:hypothetical protein
MASGNDPSDFFKAFLFIHIFRAFRMAIHPRKMVIAFVAVLLVSLAGWAMDLSKTVSVDKQDRTELDIYVDQAAELPRFLKETGGHAQQTGVFETLFRFGVKRFEESLDALKEFDVTTLFVVFDSLGEGFKALEWAFMYHLIFSLVFFAITLAVGSVAGGAICRMAALEFAQNERPGLVESLRFGCGRFRSLIAAPLTPLVIVAFMGSSIFLLGLLGNIDYGGELLLGLFMPLVLISGMLMMFVVLGALGGINLMFPTIAFENSECFTAVNNSFRYVFARPWRLSAYMAVVIVYGGISYALVRFFVFGLLLTCYRFLQLGFLDSNLKLERLWAEPRFASLFPQVVAEGSIWTEQVGAFMIRAGVMSVVGLMAAFVVSYCFSANTIIYALIRYRVDGTALSQVASVYEDDDEDDFFRSPDPH